MTDRRQFLRRTGFVTSALAGSTLVRGLPAVSAGEVADAKLPEVDSGIDATVKLIEETERKELIEVIARRVRDGMSYRELLAGIFLAGVRNVQPRPSVGFKFHSVLVVNSAHLASQASPDGDRLLPLFWALDYFKATQKEEAQKTGWHMQPVDERALPSPSKARKAFIEAMEGWDAEAADSAVAALARTAGRNELFELFCGFGARDFRSIGHKAIYVANSFRTLDCIGWRHAESVLRSLAFALQNHEGDDNPAKSDLAADRPWRVNRELARKLPTNWLDGKADSKAVTELVARLRESSPEDASQHALEAIGRGVSARSVWDAVLLASGELLMRQPGIIGLHAMTTANALHFAFKNSANESTRQMMMLQACSFVPSFRNSAEGRGKLAARTLDDTLVGADAVATSAETVERFFSEVSEDRLKAAKTLFAYLESGGNPNAVLDQARRLVFLKGRDAHDYKFSSAVLEDYHHVSPELRNQFFALSVFNLPSSSERDNPLVARIREALS